MNQKTLDEITTHAWNMGFRWGVAVGAVITITIWWLT